MVNIAAKFLLALVATMLIAGAAKWIAGRFTTEGARIASFAAGCGYAVGKYAFVKPAGTDISNNVAALAGASVALAMLWFLLFRHKDKAINH